MQDLLITKNLTQTQREQKLEELIKHQQKKKLQKSLSNLKQFVKSNGGDSTPNQ